MPCEYGFQSAPANYGGRIIVFQKSAQIGYTVSIRARQLRRANRQILLHPIHLILFQSAPANYGGRILISSAAGSGGRNVSIRARQLRRANLAPGPERTARPAFQSAPANYGGRIIRWRIPCFPGTSFNPRPPITAGESAGICPVGPVVPCFNPRPPITAGESGGFCGVSPGLGRFQSAPANYGGRIDEFRQGIVDRETVSIRARQLRRANRDDRPAESRALPGFNPRPPITAGESPHPLGTNRRLSVSIRARQLRRANRPRRPLPAPRP